MMIDKIKQEIESILFVSARAVSILELAKIFNIKKEDVEKIGDELFDDYSSGRGMQIIKYNNKFQMTTSKASSEVVRGFMKYNINKDLSKPSLETLTIIAYRGPVSKIDIERIRGVNCSLVLRNLLLRGLILIKDQRIKGDKGIDLNNVQNANKDDDIYYDVSFDFLRFLGISDIKDLPDYEKLSQDDVFGISSN